MVKKKKKLNIDGSKIPASIVICAMCFIIVYIMCIQFKTVDVIEESEIKTMREIELREALAGWKEKYKDADEELKVNNNKIKEYQDRIKSNDAAGELLEEDLEKAKMLLGLTDVKGSGVIITLSDNNDTTVISTDLLDLVNELNSAGAEAISINEQRIVNMTDIVDVSDFIMVNGKRITSSYTIKAIGDVTYLQSELSIKKGFLDKYKTNGYTISIKTDDNIVINKYDEEMTLDYVK